jgi:hypothetical protein
MQTYFHETLSADHWSAYTFIRATRNTIERPQGAFFGALANTYIGISDLLMSPFVLFFSRLFTDWSICITTQSLGSLKFNTEADRKNTGGW